jgi:Saxitoxin biosynthesis operon protein SxtJ
MPDALHENIAGHADVRVSTPRNFGLWFTLIFAVVGLAPLRSGQPMRTWALVVAGGFLILALAAPALLQPLNLAWAKVGLAIAKVMNPIVLGIIFFGVITPMGWLLRKAGKDLLQRKWQPEATSYWIGRNPPGPAPESMTKQF